MDTAHILQFLDQLQQNNNKSWMDMNRPAYQIARHTLLAITEQLIQEMSKLDKDLTSLTPAECIFRINRDIRFSKDKSLYKNNMAIYLSKEGKNGIYAGYYLHLQPRDQSFIAGGVYQPNPTVLKQIRQEIDYNGDQLKIIMTDKKFATLFGNLQGEKLQKPPKGYDVHHPYLDWLQLKSFMVVHSVTDARVAQADFIDYTLEMFRTLLPLNHFFNAALETN